MDTVVREWPTTLSSKWSQISLTYSLMGDTDMNQSARNEPQLTASINATRETPMMLGYVVGRVVVTLLEIVRNNA